jgi:hypothetical protein
MYIVHGCNRNASWGILQRQEESQFETDEDVHALRPVSTFLKTSFIL